MKKLLTFFAASVFAVSAFGQANVLYITGDGTTSNWSPENPVELAYTPGNVNYTYTFATGVQPKFKISTVKGGWSTFNGGALGPGVSVTPNQKYKLSKNDGDITTNGAPDNYILKVVYESGDYYMTLATESGETIINLPEKLYIKGSMNNWTGSDAWSLNLQDKKANTAGEYVYEGTFASLSGEFKIAENPTEWTGIDFGAGAQISPIIGERIECYSGPTNFNCSTTLTNVTLTFYYNPNGVSYLYAASSEAPKANPYYIVGDNINGINDWDFTQEMTYNESDQTYTWEGESLGSNFKFTNAPNWDNGIYGSNGQPLKLGEPYAYGVGSSTANIPFEDADMLVNNPKVVLNPAAGTVTVTGDVATIDPATLSVWLMGDFNDFQAQDEYMLNSNGDATWNGTFEMETGAKFQFLIGTSWFGCDAADTDQNVELAEGKAAITLYGNLINNNYVITEGGKYNIFVSYGEMTATLTLIDDSDEPIDPNPGEDPDYGEVIDVTFDLDDEASILSYNEDISADYNSWTTDGANKYYGADPLVLTSEGATISSAKNTSTTISRIYRTSAGKYNFRFYTGSLTTISVPAGYILNEIKFHTSGTASTIKKLALQSEEPGSLDDTESKYLKWTNPDNVDVNSITFTTSGNQTIDEITVMATKIASDDPVEPEPELPNALYVLGIEPGSALLLDKVPDMEGIYSGEFAVDSSEFSFWVVAQGSEDVQYGPVDAANFSVTSEVPYTSNIENNDNLFTTTDWDIDYALSIMVNWKEMTIDIFRGKYTGINGLENGIDGTEVIYNLQGIKVKRENAAPGIYIVNGKKTVIR